MFAVKDTGSDCLHGTLITELLLLSLCLLLLVTTSQLCPGSVFTKCQLKSKHSTCVNRGGSELFSRLFLSIASALITGALWILIVKGKNCLLDQREANEQLTTIINWTLLVF